jgi:hypothetical protein
MQRIFRLLLVVSAIVLGAVWFMKWSRTRALDSGEVHVRPTPPQSQQKMPTPEAADAASSSKPGQPDEVASTASEPPSPAAQEDKRRRSNPDGVATLPAAQPITRNAQNGIVPLTGGKFELYRQGDLTFRLNTETGQACVLFATQAQWSKTLVYEHGCGSD